MSTGTVGRTPLITLGAADDFTWDAGLNQVPTPTPTPTVPPAAVTIREFRAVAGGGSAAAWAGGGLLALVSCLVVRRGALRQPPTPQEDSAWVSCEPFQP